MNSKLLHQRHAGASQLLSFLASQQDAARRVVAAFMLSAYLVTGLVSPNVFSILNSQFSIPAASAAAGINPIIHYQGKISLLAGSAVGNGTYNMRFKIYDALSGGNILWSETWSNATTRVTMTGGLFSVGLGTHVTMTGSVNFNTDNLYLQVEFDPGNDGTYEEVFSPRRRFASVPYAHNANTLDGVDSTKFLRKDAVNVMTGSIISTSTISGSYLHASTTLTTSGSLTVKGAVRFKNYTTCSIITTDASGNLGCGSTVIASTGSVIAITDGKYVKKAGDTMTGALVINVTGGNINSVGLEVINTISGSVLHANTLLRSSGSLVTESGAYIDGTTLVVAAGPNRVGIGTASPKTALEVLGTISGSLITQNGAGSNYFLGNVGIGTISPSFALDINAGSTGAAGARISGSNYPMLRIVSSDATKGGTLRLASASTQWDMYVEGGSLRFYQGADRVTFASGGNVGIGTTNPKSRLHVVGSGTFIGTISGSSLLTLSNYRTCTLKTSATGAVICGSDNTGGTGSFGTGNVVTIGDSKYVNIGGDTMTGALTINLSSGHIGLRVIQTASGSVFHAERALTSSGLLIVKSNRLAGSGALTVVPVEFQTGAYIYGSGAAVLALETYDAQGSTKHILFGYRGNFDTNLYRSAAARLQTDGSIYVLNTVSGAYIHAERGLSSSGTLVWEGAGSGARLWVSLLNVGSNINASGSVLVNRNITARGTISGSSLLTLSNYRTCTLKTSATGAVICGSDNTGGTGSFGTGNVVTIGDSKYVNIGGDTMTGALVIDITGGSQNTLGLRIINTASGAHLHAEKTLSSSGTLVWEGSASGASLWVSYFEGAGLTDCDGDTQTLGWDSTLKRFTCGDDDTTVSSSGTSGPATATFTDSTTETLADSVADIWDGTYPNITPVETSETVLVSVQVKIRSTGADDEMNVFRIYRTIGGSTSSCSGTPVGQSFSAKTANATETGSAVLTFLDTPATTSQVNYTVCSLSESTSDASTVDNTTGEISMSLVVLDGTSGPATATFTDSTTETLADSVADIWDGTYPNITPVETSETVLVSVQVKVKSAGGTGTEQDVFRIYRTIGGSTSSCSGTPVGQSFSLITKQSTQTGSAVLTFLDEPATTSQVNYTVCSLTESTAPFSTVNNPTGEITMSLVVLEGTSGPNAATFTDTTTETLADSVADIWDGTYPNITPVETSETVLVSVQVKTRGAGSDDEMNVFRIYRTIGGSTSSCSGTPVGQSFSTWSTDSTATGSAVLTFLDEPATTSQVNYTVCSLTESTSDASTVDNTTGQISMSLVILDGTASSSSSNIAAGRGLSLSNGVITLNGTITGSLVNFTTVSGSILYAKNLLASSGTLVTESGAYIDGTTLVVAAGPNRVGIGTASPKTALEVLGTISGSLITQNGLGLNYLRANTTIGGTTTKGTLTVYGSGSFTSSISGATLSLNGTGVTTIMNYKVGIGTTAPRAKLDVLGEIVSQRNDTTGEGGFRIYQAGGTSNQTVFSVDWGSTHPLQLAHREDLDYQAFYFRDALIFNEGGANLTGGTNLMTLSGGLVGIGTTTPKAKLDVVGTISGSTLYAARSLRSSGSLVWEGSASGALLWVSQLEGAGLSDCDDGTNSKLLWDATTKRFSCGSDQGGGGGISQATADLRYVNIGGDTMTGALTINITGGTDRTIGLNVLNTISGAYIHASKGLSSSGTLMVEAASGSTNIAYFKTYNSNGYSQINVQNQSNGNNASSDIVATNDIGTETKFYIDLGINSSRYNNAAYTITGPNDGYLYTADSNLAIGTASGKALIFHTNGTLAANERMRISSGGFVGIGTTTPKTALHVVGTVSGSNIRAATLLTSSGMLIVDGHSIMSQEKGGTHTMNLLSLNVNPATGGRFMGNALQITMDAVDAEGYRGSGLEFIVDQSQVTSSGRVIAVDDDAGSQLYAVNKFGFTETLRGHVFYDSYMGEEFNDERASVAVDTATRGDNQSWMFDEGSTSTCTDIVAEGALSFSRMTSTAAGGCFLFMGTAAGDIMQFTNVTQLPRALLKIRPSRAASDGHTWAGLFIDTAAGSTEPTEGIYFTNAGGSTWTGRVNPASGSSTDVVCTGQTISTTQFALLEIIVESSTVVRFRVDNDLTNGINFVDCGTADPSAVTSNLGAGVFLGTSAVTSFNMDTDFVRVWSDDPVISSPASIVPTVETPALIESTTFEGGIVIQTNQSANPDSILNILTSTDEGSESVLRVDDEGSVFTDNTFNSAGADYAEWFRYSGTKLTSGEIVCIDITKPNTVKRCENDADSNVMGIVSTNPAFVGNVITGADGIIPPGYVLVGLIGQVPTKVRVENNEAIRPGDALTPASIAGYARKARAGESTVGVALEGLESGEGTVNVLISRRNQSLTVEAVEEKVLKTIASMEIEDEVQLMVSSALGDLNVDEQITDEVTKQIDAITAQSATIEGITFEINRLKEEIAALRSQTGTSLPFGPEGLRASNGQPLASSGQWLGANGHLAASSMELDSTLVTGGDARIGGDLSIDGTLNASALFVPNGLTIDGGVVMNGVLDAQQLHVSSGATVDGVLTINGTLRLGSGAHIDLGSGALTMNQLIVENALFVMGDITVKGMATFLGDINVKGELTVSNKFAGFAMIPKSGTSVTIFFGSGFKATPIVSVTPQDFVYTAWRTFPVTQTGFTIELSGPTNHDIVFSWFAIGVGNPIQLNRDLTEDGTIIFPTDEKGVPVSSNMAWNACIRNITLLDDSGQPLSCARYHDAYTWTHPDLNITFIWNTSATPALLQLPAGYEARIMEEAQTILDAINGTTDENVENVEDIVEPVEEEEPIVEEETIIEEEPTVEDPVVEEPVVEDPVAETPAEETPTEEPTAEPEMTPTEEPTVEPQA